MLRLRLLLPVLLAWLLLTGLPHAANAAPPPLTRLSSDPYTNGSSQHHTEVEPDTFSFGATIVAAFQVGRFHGGGASNIGWATSTDAGATWSKGFLPNTTIFAGGGYQSISDPSVTYDRKHNTWLISALGITTTSQTISVSRSLDGGLTWRDPQLVSGPNPNYDKDWIACDNTAASPYYGNCYVAWDDASNGTLKLSISNDGGATWSATSSVPGTSGLGVQPLALPNGTLVIPYLGFDDGIYAVTSPNGGITWNAPSKIATLTDHEVAGNFRSEPLPSAEMDGGGTIYLVWQDCRFIANCAANDIVLTTTTDAVTWTAVSRIPLDPATRAIEHFIPGIGADPQTSGSTAHLALAYYFYKNASCTVSTCKLNVGFATSADGGATWSSRLKLAGPMKLKWLANTLLGYMVGDYLSTSFSQNRAFPVFAVAQSKTKKFRQAMYAPTNGLPVLAGVNTAVTAPIKTTHSNRTHPTSKIQQ